MVQKAVEFVTMSFKTKKTLIEVARKGSGQLVKPEGEAIARRVLRTLNEGFVKDTDFSYSWKGVKTGIPFDLFIRLTSIVRCQR